MTVESPAESILIYEFQNKRPVDLLDLTASLTAIGEQFKVFVQRHDSALVEDGYRLYIKEVHSGSVIAELLAIASQSSLVAPFIPLVAQFGQELSDLIEFFKGAKEVRDIVKELGLGKKELQQYSNVLELVAKDSGSQLNLTATHGGVINVAISVNSMEANAAQNSMRRLIEAVPETITGLQRDQVLYWYQMRDDAVKKPGDKAIIERFSRTPVNVRFYNEDVKREMIDKPENPFKKAFVVDVDVSTIDGKPILYKIMEVKEALDRE